MVKSTSLLAYEESKEYAPTLNYTILTCLARRPERWTTVEMLATEQGWKPGTVRPRMKELWYFGLVVENDHIAVNSSKHPVVSYRPSEFALRLLRDPQMARYTMRAIGSMKDQLYTSRADHMRRNKREWESRMHAHLSLHIREVVAQLPMED